MKKINRKISIGMALVIALSSAGTIVSAENIATPRAVTASEEESNNSFALAQMIQNDYTVTGTIGSATDVDYYKVVFPYDGYANFWLGNIPSGLDYDLYLYDANQDQLRHSITTSEQELISNYSVTAGSTYYIRVIGYQGDYSTTQSYSLRVKLYLDGYTYYSQDQIDYDTTNMDKLYNTGCPNISWRARLVDEGCAVCSYAMVLNNMGKTISAPNVRAVGSNGVIPVETLEADPYSVMWATSYGPTITYNASTDKYIATSSMDPVTTDMAEISSHFGVDFDWYEIGSKDTSYKKQAIAYLLSMYPQGVCLYFQSGSNTHMIVVTESTYSAPENFVLPNPYYSGSYASKTPLETFSKITEEDRLIYESKVASKAITTLDDGDKFVVYDPYVGDYVGEGVLLSQSYTGYTYTWSNLRSIRVLH